MVCILWYSIEKPGTGMGMDIRKLFLSIAEALMVYGLIATGYGILVIHITKTWSGDWPVDRGIPWLTLDIFVMVSFALSFFGFICWRYLKYVGKAK